MMWIRRALLLIVLMFLLPVRLVSAQGTADVENRIEELQKKITELQGTENSLSKEIGILNSEISITTLRINTSKAGISKLSSEIEELNGEIDKLEELKTRRIELVRQRIPQAYKRSRVPQFGMLFFSSNFSDFVGRLKYLEAVQEADSNFYEQLQNTQVHFEERKTQREKKKDEQEVLKKQLEAQTLTLDRKKKDKQILLDQTRNSEATYQKLLAQARAEQIAIQGIIAGGGTEVSAGDVKEGDRVASVINGSSCNSSGGHLHFIVKKGSTTDSPFSHLKGISSENCSGSSCGSGDGDSFNPQGSWNWPVDGPIKFTQGYGRTWAINHTYVGRIYSFHDGIDINGSSSTVKAVQPGALYRGFFSGGGGCRLQYVKVVHSGTDISTYYLHVNY